MTTGIVHGLDINEYHASPGISKTGLDNIAKCPAMFYAHHLDPRRPARAEKAGQLEGALAHCAILEPREFLKRYVYAPADAPKRPTAAQWSASKPSAPSINAMKWWREFGAKNAGKRIIEDEQYEAAMLQAESMRKLDNVFMGMSMAELVDRGMPEVSAFWIDEITGAQLRCRPDLVVPVSNTQVVLVDVKTYSEASKREFSRQIARKRYHVQDSFYSEVYARASRKEVVGFVFAVTESQWPYLSASYQLDPVSRHEGAIEHRDNIDVYAECMRTNTWPSYTTATETVELPAYAMTNQEIEISYAE